MINLERGDQQVIEYQSSEFRSDGSQFKSN